MKTQVFIPVEPALQSAVLKQSIMDRFGGFTVFSAQGAWKMPDGLPCVEAIEIVEVFTPSQDRASNEQWFYDQCCQYGFNAKQDAVLLVHGDEPTFIHTNAA
jgi:hypothetical protein